MDQVLTFIILFLIDLLASQAVELLIKSKMMNKNAKNLGNNTALDLADAFPEIQRILLDAGVRRGRSINDLNHEVELTSEISFHQRIKTLMYRIRRSITVAQRDAYMVVAALIVTAIYQSALSPPGGLYQADSGDNNLNATSCFNCTATAAPREPGKSALPAFAFFFITALDTLILLMTAATIFFVMPGGGTSFVLFGTTFLLVLSYSASIAVISPTTVVSTVLFAVTTVFIIVLFAWGRYLN